MATVIRDAVIRIGLQQIPTELKAPDVSSIVAGQDKITQSAEKARKAVSSIGPAQEHIAASNERIRSKLAAMEERRAAAFEQRIQDRQEGERKASLAAARAADRIQTANRQALETYQQLGTGIFQVARGIAFLGAASDEELNKMLRVIAQVQGAFDVFRGGANILRAVIQLQQLHTTSIRATTAAQLGLNAAFAANPAGLAVVGITAALAVGAVAWSHWGDAAAAAADKSADRTEMLRQRLQDQLSLIRQIDRASPADASRQRLRAIGQIDTGELRQQLRAAEQREAEARRTRMRELANAPEMVRMAPGGVQEHFTGIAAQDFEVARKRELQALHTQRDLRMDLLNMERSTVQEKIAAERAASEAVQEQLSARQDLLKSRQSELEVAKQLLATERQQVLSIEAHLGTLNRGEQAELRRLAQRAAAGEQLTSEQAQRLGQLGGGLTRNVSEGQLANLGRRSAEETARILGIDLRGQQERLKAEVERRQGEFQAVGGAQGLRDVAEARRKAESQHQETIDRWLQSTNRMIDAIQVIDGRMKVLESDAEARLGATL